MTSAERYVCTLDKRSVEKAEKELNENVNERGGAVESLRQWIIQNKKWLKSPTDTTFLLGFLRNAKFVQLAARKRLVNYWAARSDTPEWFGNIDTTDPKLVECLRSGFCVIPSIKDNDGRTLFIGRMGYMDVSGKYTIDEYFRVVTALVDYLLMDETIQVNGTLIVEDMSKVSIKHQMFLGVDKLKKTMHVWIKCFPLRYKGIHYFNTNPIFEAMFLIIGPLLPEKLKQRLYIHGANLPDMYKHIDKSLFPLEYLADDYKGKSPGSIDQVIENTINELQKPEVRDAILKLSSAEYGVDKSLKPDDMELYAESFRQLNID